MRLSSGKVRQFFCLPNVQITSRVHRMSLILIYSEFQLQSRLAKRRNRNNFI